MRRLLVISVVFGGLFAAPVVHAGEAVGSNDAPLVAPSSSTAYIPRLGPGLAARIRRDGPARRQRFVAKGLSASTIRAAGGEVTAQIGPIVSGVLSGYTLMRLAPTSIRVEAPKRLRPALDVSREATHVDEADFATEGFDAGYRGAGALIGIYDTGIDLRHPDLREVDGPTRVRALWDQTRRGAPPPGQLRGDACDAEELEADDCPHVDTVGHGTLISSIAASNAPQYRGMAPDASLAVATSTAFDMFIESLAWFADVQEALEQPLVVNVSLSGQEGPHDGTSLAAQAVDAFDHLVVTAAGNEGALPVHAVARLEKGDTTYLALDFPLRPDPATRHAIVDIWGDVGPNVSAQVQIWDREGRVLAETATIAPGDPGRTVALGDEDQTFGSVDLDTDDPLTVENRQGHIRVELLLPGWEDAPDGRGYVVIRIRGEGRIDAWVDSPVSEPSPIAFDRNRVLDSDEQTLGDTDHTISDLATAISAVAVSAYVTRTTFTTADGIERNVNGDLGKIAAFSSWGPTLSESTTGPKPDIAAPGHLVIGARSRASGPDASAVSELYRAAAGTSMAAPHVAGVAAVILGARPEVSKTDLKGYLLGGAATDDDVDPELDPRWGSGKLDAAESLRIALGADPGCSCRTALPEDRLLWSLALIVFAGWARRRRLSTRPGA